MGSRSIRGNLHNVLRSTDIDGGRFTLLYEYVFGLTFMFEYVFRITLIYEYVFPLIVTATLFRLLRVSGCPVVSSR